MQITTPGRRVFPFEVTREGVSTEFVEIDIIYGVGVSDERRSSLIEPVGRTTRCRSSEEVFKVLDSCLLTATDSSPDGWMFLAALFACDDEETGAASSPSQEGTFDQFLKSYGEFVVGGWTLTDCSRSSQLSNRSNSSTTKGVLPTLERRRWREYFCKLTKL